MRVDFFMLLFLLNRNFVIAAVYGCGVGEHHFDTVLLIHTACARVIIYRHDIGIRVLFLKLIYHALACDMVWQTAEGLRADYVIHAV